MRKTVLAAMAAICLVGIHSTSSQAMNCEAYVRSVTGFDLSGNAYQWWNSAAGVYARGHRPEIGAVMVFSRTRGMSKGHVAVVRAIRNSREILVDHANWGRDPHCGTISKANSVIDVSPHNDWTEVRVEGLRTSSYGRVNPVDGFIYSDGDSLGALASARFLMNKFMTLAADEPVVAVPVTPCHGRKAHTLSTKNHGRAHAVTATLHPHGACRADGRLSGQCQAL